MKRNSFVSNFLTIIYRGSIMWIVIQLFIFQLFIFSALILGAAILPKKIYGVCVLGLYILTFIQIVIPWLAIIQYIVITSGVYMGWMIIYKADYLLDDTDTQKGVIQKREKEKISIKLFELLWRRMKRLPKRMQILLCISTLIMIATGVGREDKTLYLKGDSKYIQNNPGMLLVTDNMKLICLDKKDGDLQWEISLPDELLNKGLYWEDELGADNHVKHNGGRLIIPIRTSDIRQNDLEKVKYTDGYRYMVNEDKQKEACIDFGYRLGISKGEIIPSTLDYTVEIGSYTSEEVPTGLFKNNSWETTTCIFTEVRNEYELDGAYIKAMLKKDASGYETYTSQKVSGNMISNEYKGGYTGKDINKDRYVLDSNNNLHFIKINRNEENFIATKCAIPTEGRITFVNDAYEYIYIGDSMGVVWVISRDNSRENLKIIEVKQYQKWISNIYNDGSKLYLNFGNDTLYECSSNMLEPLYKYVIVDDNTIQAYNIKKHKIIWEKKIKEGISFMPPLYIPKQEKASWM